MTSDRPPTRNPSVEVDNLWIPTVGIAGPLSTLYLAVLVMRLDPLPVVDLATASIVAVGFSLVCILALVFVLRLPVFSFTLVVAIGAFLISLGAFVVYPFEGDLAFGTFKVIHYDALSRGLPVVMLAFSALTLGSTIALGSRRRKSPVASPDLTSKVEATYQTALILYAISMSLMVLFSLVGPGVFTSITGSYTGGGGFMDLRKAGEMSPAVTLSLIWFLPWTSVIMLSTSRGEKQFARSTILAAAVCGFSLLAGTRGTAVVLIAQLLQIRHLRGYPVRWRRIALLGLLTMGIIITWPTFRTIPVKDWRPGVLIEALQTRYSDASNRGSEHLSTAGHVLGGIGTSYQPVMVACYYVPEIEPYRLGFDYFRSIVTAVPYAARAFPDFLRLEEAPSGWMMGKIDPNFWIGRGFNQIAEAYLQGGAVGVTLLYLLLGWYLAWLWRHLPEEPDLRMLAFHSLAVLAVYKWMRNDSGSAPRTLLWAAILVYLLPAVYRWLQGRMADSPATEEGAPPASREEPFPGTFPGYWSG